MRLASCKHHAPVVPRDWTDVGRQGGREAGMQGCRDAGSIGSTGSTRNRKVQTMHRSLMRTSTLVQDETKMTEPHNTLTLVTLAPWHLGTLVTLLSLSSQLIILSYILYDRLLFTLPSSLFNLVDMMPYVICMKYLMLHVSCFLSVVMSSSCLHHVFIISFLICGCHLPCIQVR